MMPIRFRRGSLGGPRSARASRKGGALFASGLLFAILAATGVMAQPAGLSSIGAEDLVLPYGSSLVRLGPSGPFVVGTWPGDARPRDAASFPGGCVAWERKSAILYRASSSGLVPLGKLEAAKVYLSRERGLSSSGLFEEGKGFVFQAWSWPGGTAGSLRKTASFSLDCFVADCLFLGDRAYIAGADAADRENSVYEFEFGSGRLRKLASMAKHRDFGRLACDGFNLLFYTSVSEPTGGPARALLFALDAKGGAAAGRALDLMPESVGASPYGSAFVSGGVFRIPFARGKGAETNVELCSFHLADLPAAQAGGGAMAVKPASSMALPTGVYAPIGERPGATAASGAFWAFGYLYVRDPSAFSLLRIGQAGATVTGLPLAR